MTDGRPYRDTELARFLDKRISQLRGRRSQKEIATLAGFPNANMMSMLKSGANKVPIDRVVPLAEALETDARYLSASASSRCDTRRAQGGDKAWQASDDRLGGRGSLCRPARKPLCGYSDVHADRSARAQTHRRLGSRAGRLDPLGGRLRLLPKHGSNRVYPGDLERARRPGPARPSSPWLWRLS